MHDESISMVLVLSANILTCNELFATRRSIVGLVFNEVVIIINIMFKKLIIWHVSDKMQFVIMGFKNFCDMPSVMGAIDGAHICIVELVGVFSKNYYYHKTRGYNIVAEVVVNSWKRILDIYVGLLGSVNESTCWESLGCFVDHNMRDSLTWLWNHKMECFHIFMVTMVTHSFPGLWPHIKKKGNIIQF